MNGVSTDRSWMQQVDAKLLTHVPQQLISDNPRRRPRPSLHECLVYIEARIIVHLAEVA